MSHGSHVPIKLIVKDAIFLTSDPENWEPFSGWMAVGADGTIERLEAGSPPASVQAAETLDVRGAFVAPGFVSAHSHLFTSGSRGLGMDKTLYGWVEEVARTTRQAGPEDIYWMTVHGSFDFLNNGITTAYDFTSGRLEFERENGIPRQKGGTLRPKEYAQAQLRAKVDTGIRFLNSVGLDDSVGTLDEVLGRFAELEDYAAKYRHQPGYLGLAISGAVQWAMEEQTARTEAEAMRQFGVINQPHFLETAQEMEQQRTRFSWYRDAGVLGPTLVFGHFVHPTEDMMVEAAKARCGMVWQPMSNGRLASGVADIPHLRGLGMEVGVGLDDQSCTDISDPFQNMRVGIYLQRARHLDPAAMPVGDMLFLHTLGSARVLGIDGQVGSLAVGKYADFLVVDPREPDTGPVWDAVGTYVLACGLRNLKQVYVGGELVSDCGRLTDPLASEAAHQVHERLPALALPT